MPRQRRKKFCRCGCGTAISPDASLDVAYSPGHYRRARKLPRTPRIEGDLAYIPLTKNKEAIVDVADLHLVAAFCWSACEAIPGLFYAIRVEDHKRIKMQNVIFGPCPHGTVVDHEDNNSLNNRRSNLRAATAQQNLCNKPCRSKSGYKGVSTTDSGKWKAHIMHNYKPICLGRHATAEQAARAYDVDAKRIQGQFAKLNFPEKT